jgi:hypothetical protein
MMAQPFHPIIDPAKEALKALALMNTRNTRGWLAN